MLTHQAARKTDTSMPPAIGKRNSKAVRSATAFDTILSLHSTLGNRAVQRLIESGTLQPKLKIGAPNDKYEKEADHVADQVTRMPSSDIQKKPLISGLNHNGSVQRMCPECEEEMQRQPIAKGKEKLQHQTIEAPEKELLMTKWSSRRIQDVTPDIESQIHSPRGAGQPLDPTTRSFMEPRFGRDLDDIRIHTNATANRLARSIQAEAFTTGRDVVFNSGQYNPHSATGKHLLAHELTHVVQQGRDVQRSVVMRKEEDSPLPDAYRWVNFDDKGGWDATVILSKLSQNEGSATEVPKNIEGAGEESDKLRCTSNVALSAAIVRGPMATIKLCVELKKRIKEYEVKGQISETAAGMPSVATCGRAYANVSRILLDIYFGSKGSAQPGGASTLQYRDFDSLAHWLFVFSYNPRDEGRVRRVGNFANEQARKYRSSREAKDAAKMAGYDAARLDTVTRGQLDAEVMKISKGGSRLVFYHVHALNFFRSKTDGEIYLYDPWKPGDTLFKYGSDGYYAKISQMYAKERYPKMAWEVTTPNLEMWETGPDLEMSRP